MFDRIIPPDPEKLRKSGVSVCRDGSLMKRPPPPKGLQSAIKPTKLSLDELRAQADALGYKLVPKDA